MLFKKSFKHRMQEVEAINDAQDIKLYQLEKKVEELSKLVKKPAKKTATKKAK